MKEPPHTPGSNGPLSIFSRPVDEPPSDWEVIRAIWAIPSTVLSAESKQLLCVHVNHCGCGRTTSFSSNETLAIEAGVEVPQISKMNAALVHGVEKSTKRRNKPIAGGWLIEHRHGRSKFSERHYEIGPLTWEWVRRNLAAMAARREANQARRAIPAPSASAEGHLAQVQKAPCASAEGNLARVQKQNSSLNTSNKHSVNPVVRLFSPLEEEKSNQEIGLDREETVLKKINGWIDHYQKDTPDLDQVATIMNQRLTATAYDRELIRQAIERRKAERGC